MKTLTDTFGRKFPYIRLSITDVCNYKCTYCLPEGYKKTPGDTRSFMTGEEISRLTNALSELGVCKIRLTGGEPTVRKDFFDILKNMKQNSNIPKILQNVNQNIKVKHQCGINKLTDVINLYEKSNISAEVQEFYQNPQSLIEWSDFVITRSGALSISEISSMGRGMVMIPLPSSIDNHQFHNAKYIENIGMGIVHSEEDGINELEKKITQVIEEKTYNSWKAVTNLEHLNAATLISSKIIESLSK